MEKHIAEAMNDNILKDALVHYDVEFEAINMLNGFENLIYEYEKDGEGFILRFVHSTHREYQMVLAELEFIDFLDRNGANVSTVIHTNSDELVVKIPTVKEEYFTVSVFTRAPGTFVKREEITEQFAVDFGIAVGKLHQLTKMYEPEIKRYEWFDENIVDLAIRNVPENKKYITDKLIDQIEILKGYETSVDDYGLIHTDLHYGNMYFDGKDLTFFDWDDAAYKHFISDIAIIIFYSYGTGDRTETEIEDKSIWFLKHFMKGYNKENSLDKIWFERMNEFLRLRMLILAVVIYAAGEELLDSPFAQRFFRNFDHKIKDDIPFFNIERVLKELWSS